VVVHPLGEVTIHAKTLITDGYHFHMSNVNKSRLVSAQRGGEYKVLGEKS
jgi:hypothetical protein